MIFDELTYLEPHYASSAMTAGSIEFKFLLRLYKKVV